MKKLQRTMAAICAACVLGISVPLPAQAGLIGTEEAVPAYDVKERVRESLARQEVRDALAAHGVDPAQVQARVDALTSDEARLLAERIDQMPAGGADILGVLLTVFIVLLITDILGLTKVFPFTRPIR
jgi:hypothetical protein